MATYRWPSTGRNRPVDAVQHASCLNTDFDSVSNTANASLANTTLLPSGLESRISKGITKGIAEACSNGFCPKWSETDKSILSKVMLKNINNEAALEARDRIPLPQFNGLHESYNVLHAKLIPPTATTHQFVGAGAATEATSVIDLVKAAYKANEEANRSRTPPGMLTNQQGENMNDGNDGENGEDTDEEEEDEMDESDDAESEQEVIEDGDNKSGDDSSEEGSSDDGSSSEDGSETDSDTGGEEVGDQDIARKGGVVPYMKRDGRGFSTTIILKIEQQASVNRLEEMTTPELSSCLSRSLKDLLHEQQLSSRNVYLSGVNLLGNGDLRLTMHAGTREALQRIFDSANWGQKLEKALGCWQVQTHKVRMHTMNSNTLQFQDRKEKAAIIRQLAEANRAISQANDTPIIRDIRWPRRKVPRQAASLIVEFSDPKEANETLTLGLWWQKRRHGCEREGKFKIKRCSRCQGYGHLCQGCSAPYQCGKCAEKHPTETCTSRRSKCASCGGGHKAGYKNCPAKAKARRDLDFLNKTAYQARKRAVKAQVTPPTPVRQSVSVERTQTETSIPSPVSMDSSSAEEEVKPEPHRSLPQVDSTQDHYLDTATLLEKIEELRKETEDIRKIVVARDSALQKKSSGRTKRQAKEAFESEGEPESSTATKRIKQEEPTREDSMGLYRQPSPFIVHRPQ